MNAFERLKGEQISGRTAFFSIVILLVVLGGGVFLLLRSQQSGTESTPRKSATVRTPQHTTASMLPEKDIPDDPNTNPKKGEHQPVDPYAVIAERNLFKPLGPATPAAPAKPAGKPGPAGPPQLPPGGPGPGMVPPVQMMPGVQLAEMRRQLACTGIVETSIGKMALIEKLDTKESQFLAVDQSAYGFRLAAISLDFVTLEKDGLQFTLNIGENKSDSDPNAKPAAAPPQGGPPPAQAAAPQPAPQPTPAVTQPPQGGRFQNGGGNRNYRR